ncbi:hypothetical protein MP228_012289 [Amoeboaphelidium protococcarum]|nr:hypothetical protein MP228_012289 [Amoeboaphelidium protococcarum]
MKRKLNILSSQSSSLNKAPQSRPSTSQSSQVASPSIDQSGQSSSITISRTSKQENVIVGVRVRPLSSQELESRDQEIWEVSAGMPGQCNMSQEFTERMKRPPGSTDYAFDMVFTGSDTLQIYDQAIGDIVQSAVDGYNATVFCYGQTNSGKTFTMTGREQQPGLIPCAVEDIFAQISGNQEREFLLRVSYMEIYNETIKDLINPANRDIKIHEDKHKGIYVSPLKEVVVSKPEDVVKLLKLGDKNRHTSTTDYNEHSSRSHAIFQITIESKQKLSDSSLESSASNGLEKYRNHGGKAAAGKSVKVSTLSLIDLAGSEKASSSADRRREGAYINRSLLTLGTVISRLVVDKNGHIPYRDSKLTRILQPSLQGNARVGVICTVSPAACNYEETINTLKFAQRIKKVVTSAEQREILDDKTLLLQYKNEIEQLKSKLNQIGQQEVAQSLLAVEKQRLEEELQQQQLVRSALQERIDQLTKMILTSSSTSSQPNAANAAAIAQQKKQNRLSLMQTARQSTPDLVEEDSELTGKLSYQQLQQKVLKLESDLTGQSKELEELRDELDAYKNGDNSTVDAQTADSNQIATQYENQIRELEAEIERLRNRSPSDLKFGSLSLLDDYLEQDKYTDKVNELLTEIDSLHETIMELNQAFTEKDRVIQNLQQQLNQVQTARPSSGKSSTQGDDRQHQSPNASYLSSLLRPLSSESSAASSSGRRVEFPPSLDPPTPIASSPVATKQGQTVNQPSISELQMDLQKEKTLRKNIEERQSDRIAMLETELTVTQAQLSVAQLQQEARRSTQTSKSINATSQSQSNQPTARTRKRSVRE